MVDPKRCGGARPIYDIGGSFPRTQLVECKAEVDFTVGSGGIGFCLINPGSAGPTTDRPVALYSDSSVPSIPTSALPVAQGGGANNLLWGSGGLYLSASGPLVVAGGYRVAYCAAYVYPIGSLNGMNGNIYLYEAPGHQSVGITFQQIESASRTRAIRGTQAGPVKDEIVLNWHPQRSTWGSGNNNNTTAVLIDDFLMRSCISMATNPRLDDSALSIHVSGVQGTQYHVEIYAGYEIVGYTMGRSKMTYMDSRGWDLIQNAIAAKAISGWIGTPAAAKESYHHAIVSRAAKANDLEPETEKKLEKTSFWDKASPVVSELANMAKDVAGFLL